MMVDIEQIKTAVKPYYLCDSCGQFVDSPVINQTLVGCAGVSISLGHCGTIKYGTVTVQELGLGTAVIDEAIEQCYCYFTSAMPKNIGRLIQDDSCWPYSLSILQAALGPLKNKTCDCGARVAVSPAHASWCSST